MNLLVRPLLRYWSRWLRTVWIGSPADSVRTGGGLLVWQEDATVCGSAAPARRPGRRPEPRVRAGCLKSASRADVDNLVRRLDQWDRMHP